MTTVVIIGGDSSLLGYQRYLGQEVIADQLARAGWRVRLINAAALDYDEIAELVLNDWDSLALVAVSTTFLAKGSFGNSSWLTDLQQHQQFQQQIRQQHPQVRFAVGGYYAGFRDYRRFGWTVFLDHSDELIVKWLEGPQRVLPTVESNNPNRQFLSQPHQWQALEQGEAIPIEISRGCRFRCAFCRYSLNGRSAGLYTRSSECLAQEIRETHDRWGTQHYQFADDTLNETTEKLTELLRARDLAGVDFDFTAYIRLDLVESHPEQAAMLRDLGLKNATLGIETLNHKSAQSIGKGRDPRRQLDYLAQLKSTVWSQVHTHSGFIIGLPHDTRDNTQPVLEEFAKDTGALDSVVFRSLSLMHPNLIEQAGSKISLSEFDLDPQRWGYEWQGPQWYNTKTGMTQAEASQIAEHLTEINDAHSKPRVAGFSWPMLYNIGIPAEILDSQSIGQISREFDIEKLTLDRINRSRVVVYEPYSLTHMS